MVSYYVSPHSPRQRKSPTPHEGIARRAAWRSWEKVCLSDQVVDGLDKNHSENDQPDDSPGDDLRVTTVQLKLFNVIYVS